MMYSQLKLLKHSSKMPHKRNRMQAKYCIVACP